MRKNVLNWFSRLFSSYSKTWWFRWTWTWNWFLFILNEWSIKWWWCSRFNQFAHISILANLKNESFNGVWINLFNLNFFSIKTVVKLIRLILPKGIKNQESMTWNYSHEKVQLLTWFLHPEIPRLWPVNFQFQECSHTKRLPSCWQFWEWKVYNC